MNDTVMIRPKRNERSGKGNAGFVLMKHSKNPDLSEHVFLNESNGVDVYVHKDDYEHYKGLMIDIEETTTTVPFDEAMKAT